LEILPKLKAKSEFNPLLRLVVEVRAKIFGPGGDIYNNVRKFLARKVLDKEIERG